MFKKNDESEWTRFSRALGGAQSPAREDDLETADETEDPVTLAQVAPAEPEVSVAPPPPPPPPSAVVEQDETTMPVYTPPAPPMGSAHVFNDPPSRPAMSPGAADGETVVGEGATIDGTLRSERSIRVRGSVQGEIESSQQVIVEEAAQVQARITGQTVAVYGEVNGAIIATGRVEIASTARVTGEVTAGTLSIQEGAYFEGSLKMTNTRIEA
jgi:cytoskeletal protein CcmA (bactofilin family)